jgi:translation initiation factor 5B
LKQDAFDMKISYNLSANGIGVAASTLGSLEALMTFLENNQIPVSFAHVGTVTKDMVNKVHKAM